MNNQSPTIQSRIPEHRAVDGLEYGAHVSRPGLSGYHVRLIAADSDAPWVIALQTPDDDALPGDGCDMDIIEGIREEVEALGKGDIDRESRWA